MANVSHALVTAAFEKRYDYQSARSVLRAAMSRAGVGEKDSYTDDECKKIVSGLQAMGERGIDAVLQALGMGPPPAATGGDGAAAAAPPAKEEKKAEAKEEKKEEKKADAKADDKKADAKADDKKADAKADDKKADAKEEKKEEKKK